MKIYNINPFRFTGQRQDRNTVSQLKQDNPYDLNEINRRKISQSIDNLSEIAGEDNVKFLIDVSENLKYGTNIDLNKKSFNDWNERLSQAAKKSLSKSSQDVQERLSAKVDALSTRKPLTTVEKEILSLRESLLAQVDKSELDKIHSENIKNFNRNLDYFIISSEISTSQKLYIMKRLNHFMSPEYKIDPQLKDKKTQALAEIINDIVVDTPESKIPNIKSINQRQHGMCAAISICRKALAYEDKANFVDMVMSELEDNPQLMVYDITKLGTHTKVPINKSQLDFEYALSRGYRIIDTSALYWMHVADTEMSKNEPTGMYFTFDKDYFDTFHDSHLLPDLDEEMAKNQDYYRGLLKTKEAIANIKKNRIVTSHEKELKRLTAPQKREVLVRYTRKLGQALNEISPDLSQEKRSQIIADIISLEVKNSEAIKKVQDYRKDFTFLPNEAQDVKVEKIKAFLSVALPERNAKKLTQNAPRILDIVSTINFINPKESNSYFSKNIKYAKDLYGAAAAYRTQNIMRLEIPEELNDLLISFDIKDRESLIADNMDLLIQRLKKNKVSKEIRETLATNFATESDNEALVVALEENKKSLDYIMTEVLDNIYGASLAISRKNVLLNELKEVREEIQNGDSVVLINFARNIKSEPNQQTVLNRLDKYINILESEDCTEENYKYIYNRVGKKTQMQDCADIIGRLYSALFVDKDEKIISGFQMLHGLAPDTPPEEMLEVFTQLANNFNSISAMITALQNALEVRADDGTILNTVIGKELIIKKLENKKEIISAQDLRAFQERFNQIDKYRTEDNGEIVKLKDLPKELTTLTKHDKEVLDLISANINGWYKQTNRALNLLYNQIEEPLSELNRKVGVQMGRRILHTEGGSGLYDPQQVKIFEHMTDRPYYAESNTKLAIEKIKEIPYSGISGTSVNDKQAAYHAQYIADIKPVQIKNNKGEIITQDALFHDNSWGPSEHENTWIDSDGMLRTDYARQYGGDIGYITDGKYRNGKLLKNIIGQVGVEQKPEINNKQYKKLSPYYGEEYKFSMFDSVIVPGKNPTAKSYVRQIRSNMLVPSNLYFDDLEKAAKSMTYEEIKSVIYTTENLGAIAQNEYDEIEKRVFGITPFSNGIKTKKDYDKLSDNDPIKILFEKLALLRSYSDFPDTKLFYNKFSMSDLDKIRDQIRKDARRNFNYTFGKHKDIAIYGTERSRKMLNAILTNFALENNFKLEPEDLDKIVNSLKRVKVADFDGSINTTVKLMSNSFVEYFSKNTPNFENKDEKIKILAMDIEHFLKEKMTITIEDMHGEEFEGEKVQKIVKWIDRVFNPVNDEEFVEIFKNLQNMTTQEFESKYGSTITDEDMGIIKTSGYDVLTQYRALDERTYNAIFNLLYYQKFGNDMKMSKMVPGYDYKKFEKISRGGYYKQGQRTFDDIYSDYYWSLYMLNTQDIRSRMRKNLFKQYGVFPAYPIVEFEDQKELATMIQTFEEELNDSIESMDSYNVQDLTIGIVKDLNNYISKFKPDTKISATQKEYIDALIKDFINLNDGDESIKTSLEAAYNISELPDNTTASDYKKNIKAMYDEISMFAVAVGGQTMKDSIKKESKILQDKKREFVTYNFAPKYHAKAYGILNKYTEAKKKNLPNAQDIYRYEFTSFFDKHRITKHPEEFLNEYLLRIAKSKDGVENSVTDEKIRTLEAQIKKLKKTKSTSKSQIAKLEAELKNMKEKNDVTQTFKANLKGLLDCANVLELEQIFMDCAKEANLNIVRDEFKTSQIKLNNGQIVDMNSNEALNMLLMPLIISGNEKTTMMFTEQLGLEDGVAKMLMASANIENVKSAFVKIDEIYSAVSDQTQYVQDALNNLGNIDNDADGVEKIKQLRKELVEKFKQTKYPKTATIIKNAITGALKVKKDNPEQSMTALMYVQTEMAKQSSIYLASMDIKNINSGLIDFQHIVNFARKLKLSESSPVKAEFDTFLEELDRLDEYAGTFSKNYDNINVSTIATDEIY